MGGGKMNKEKQNYVYYIYFQDEDLEPVYVVDWYEDSEGAFINVWSTYRDFAYIFTTYDQAKNVMIKLQANDEWEKYLIGLIAL